MDEPHVTIDDEFQLRVLDPEVHERSTRLVADCELFVSSTCSSSRCSFLDSSYAVLSSPSTKARRKSPSLSSPPPPSLSPHHTHVAPPRHVIFNYPPHKRAKQEVREFQAIVESIHADMHRMAKKTERQRLKAIGKRILLERRRN
jgi:hypothetical protein